MPARLRVTHGAFAVQWQPLAAETTRPAELNRLLAGLDGKRLLTPGGGRAGEHCRVRAGLDPHSVPCALCPWLRVRVRVRVRHGTCTSVATCILCLGEGPRSNPERWWAGEPPHTHISPTHTSPTHQRSLGKLGACGHPGKGQCRAVAGIQGTHHDSGPLPPSWSLSNLNGWVWVGLRGSFPANFRQTLSSL